MTMTNIFGVDLGMGAIKLYGAHGGLQVLSQVALAGAQKVQAMLGLANKRPPLEIVTATGQFYVGDGAHDWGRPIENMDYDRLTGSPEITALFLAAMTRYLQAHGPLDGAVAVMVGLPLETMLGDAAQTNADAVRRWLKGQHEWTADGEAYALEIDDARCTSQPAAAYFDAILDPDGKLIPGRRLFASAEVGVISIGFNTIELLVVRDKAPVQRFTAGSTVGVRRLLELVNRERHYSRGELDVLLRANKLDIREALPIWSREVFGQIETQWGRMFRRFACVIVVGGGSILLRDALMAKFNGKAMFPDDPVLAIARGLCKFALMRRGRTTSTATSEASQVAPADEAPAELAPTDAPGAIQNALLPMADIPIKPVLAQNGLLA